MKRFTKTHIKFLLWRHLLVLFFGCAFGLIWQPLAIAKDDYRLNPGDKLVISVWGEDNLHSEVAILPDGNISFPLAGQIPAARKTTEELVTLIKDRLSKYIPNPEINIRVLAADGNAIYVVGEVTHPGAIEMKRPIDVMQALSMAGGLTPFAEKCSIRILRHGADGRSYVLHFNYGSVEDGENIESNIMLQSGDTIVVP